MIVSTSFDWPLRAHFGDGAHQRLEVFVTGDEVGLGIDLDDDAAGAGEHDADQAFGSDAAALLGGLGQALLAQPVDRALDITGRLGQRVLAIHHAGAGLLAKLLHHASGNRRHRTWSLFRGARTCRRELG